MATTPRMWLRPWQWTIEERNLSIIGLLHALWYKNIDLRPRHLQQVQMCDPAGVLTKFSAKLLKQSSSSETTSLFDLSFLANGVISPVC